MVVVWIGRIKSYGEFDKGIASQLKSGIREGLDDFLSLGEKEDRHTRSTTNNFNFDDEVEASRPLTQALA